MSQPDLVHVDTVRKNYAGPAGEVTVLKGVSLHVKAGEFVGVRGPSGSGKSTLINMITGIDRPTSGAVTIAGTRIDQMSENNLARFRGLKIGVIFQFFQLLPTLTVLENTMLPMEFCRVWKPRERIERASMLLEQVGLTDQAHKLPNTLSGGQQQRAAIARALANDPPLLVGDEPTGNLDSRTADRVFQLFDDLVKLGKTFIMVTHDNELAARIPRVIQVQDGVLLEGQGLHISETAHGRGTRPLNGHVPPTPHVNGLAEHDQPTHVPTE
jgi:putative ABC transport system ATP-binding protein